MISTGKSANSLFHFVATQGQSERSFSNSLSRWGGGGGGERGRGGVRFLLSLVSTGKRSIKHQSKCLTAVLNTSKFVKNTLLRVFVRVSSFSF